MSAPFLTNTTNPGIMKLVEHIDEIAVLPHVVYKVLELSATTDTAASELERTIVVDPGFSTRLLSLANSAFYGLPKRVSSIREAVTFLGYKQIRQLAMTVGFFDMFVGKNDKGSLRRRAWWRHSIDSAVTCRWLAQMSGKFAPDEAYTCGLLHYIGKPLLDRHDPEGYLRVEELVATADYSDLDAEYEVFGGTHVEVALAACRKWRLPESLVTALDYRCEPTEESVNPIGAAIVAIASNIASAAVDGPSALQIPDWTRQFFSFQNQSAEDLLEKAIDVIASSRSMQF